MTIVSSAQFDMIYIPVLILCAGLFLFSGWRQKYPVSTVAGITVFLMVLFVVGMKIISYPVTEWQNIFSHSPVEIHHSKYLPGGIIFVAVGMIILKLALKIRLAFLDSLILGLPLIGIIQRVDCLLSGCCFGTPTQLPWAIHYSAISPAFKQQVSEGLISDRTTSSLGIHPTQIYYIIGFILVFCLLAISRRKLKAPGSLALVGFILMAVSRFIIEFFREPVGNKLSSLQWADVNLLQWIILGLVLISALMLYQLEKKYKILKPVPPKSQEYLLRSSLILFISALLVWNFSRILAYSEFFLLQILLFLSVLVIIFRLFQKSTIPSLRYATISALFLTIIFMSQKSTDTIINNDSIIMPSKWWDVKASAGGGNYDKINYDCSGNETDRTPQHYSIVSGGFAYNHVDSRKHHIQTGLNLGKLYDSGDLLGGMSSTSSNMNSLYINFINPYFKYNFHKIGFGAGYNFLLGEGTPGLPSLYFRAGALEKYFFDVNLADNFSSSGIAGVWQIGVGSGLGKPEKHLFRAGISTVENKVLVYFDGEFLLYDRLFMHTTLDVGNKIHGMLGLKYQIGKNR